MKYIFDKIEGDDDHSDRNEMEFSSVVKGYPENE